ncbi:MAG TPA: TetR/AcrR family transcriptional regulator [Clostridiaceae bacterium]|nr:TetR/AcrR family transcriptional regulator [Clostridiaceae bacterium]
MPKVVDYKKTKDKIVSEAMNLFLHKGYHSTTLLDISRRCNMGRTTIYKYFENKEGILYYAISQSIKMLRNDLRSIMQLQDVSIIEKIKLVISRVVLEYPKNNRFVALSDLRELCRIGDSEVLAKVREYVQELRNTLKELLQAGMDSKEIKLHDREKMAYTLYAIIESLVLHFSNNQYMVLSDENMILSEQLNTVHILIDGLRA